MKGGGGRRIRSGQSTASEASTVQPHLTPCEGGRRSGQSTLQLCSRSLLPIHTPANHIRTRVHLHHVLYQRSDVGVGDPGQLGRPQSSSARLLAARPAYAPSPPIVLLEAPSSSPLLLEAEQLA